jgi:protein-S-isoprenylcysteine O-methyltransferase Ste14
MKNALSILGFLMAAAALAVLIFIRHLVAHHPVLIAVQAGSFLLMIWARLTFGRRSFHAAASPSEGGLVTTGPYRFWRHPIYAAVIYFVWAGQVESPDLVPVILAFVVTLGLYLRMLIEEDFLRAVYPEYPSYMRRAKRLVPFVY